MYFLFYKEENLVHWDLLTVVLMEMDDRLVFYINDKNKIKTYIKKY